MSAQSALVDAFKKLEGSDIHVASWSHHEVLFAAAVELGMAPAEAGPGWSLKSTQAQRSALSPHVLERLRGLPDEMLRGVGQRGLLRLMLRWLEREVPGLDTALEDTPAGAQYEEQLLWPRRRAEQNVAESAELALVQKARKAAQKVVALKLHNDRLLDRGNQDPERAEWFDELRQRQPQERLRLLASDGIPFPIASLPDLFAPASSELAGAGLTEVEVDRLRDRLDGLWGRWAALKEALDEDAGPRSC